MSRRFAHIQLPCVIAILLSFAPSAAADGDLQPGPLEAMPYFSALSVADVEASTEWYRRLLGVEVVREIDLPDRGFRIRLLRSAGTFLELLENRAARSRSDLEPPVEKGFDLHGPFKLGFLVPDLDAAIERLEELDIPLRGKVATESDGSLRSLQIEDPDGNVIQLFERLDG